MEFIGEIAEIQRAVGCVLARTKNGTGSRWCVTGTHPTKAGFPSNIGIPPALAIKGTAHFKAATTA